MKKISNCKPNLYHSIPGFLGSILFFLIFSTLGLSADNRRVDVTPLADYGQGVPNKTVSINAQTTESFSDADMSFFLHGINGDKTQMGTRITINLTTTVAGYIGVDVIGASTWTSNSVGIYRNSTTHLVSKSFSVLEVYEEPESLEYYLEPGSYVITFKGEGQDWVQVQSYYFRESPPPPPPEPPEIISLTWESNTVSQFSKAEASFQLDKDYSNPYDPVIVSVEAVISGPENIQYTIPAFWYEGYTWNQAALEQYIGFSAVPQSQCWKLRFTPTLPGTWSVVFSSTDENGNRISEPYSIEVESSDNRGFLRIDENNRQEYRFDNSDPLTPIGFNLSWNDGSLGNFYDYYMGEMNVNGANWIRYWMCGFGRQSIEWSTSHWSNIYEGLGKYSQQAGSLLDHVVDNAEANNIYIQLVLEHHGAFSEDVDPNWDKDPVSGTGGNPYNQDVEGWLDEPIEFFSDAAAIEQAKKKYRYIIARWGYSPNIFAWELWNEVQWTILRYPSNQTEIDLREAQITAVTDWHKLISTYLKDIDPYNHLITTSWDRNELLRLDSHPDLDILQDHKYAPSIAFNLASFDSILLNNLDKTVLVGEFGSNSSYNDADGHPDLWGDHVRQSSWIGSIRRVPNMFWFWDHYLYNYDLFDLYAPLSRYWTGEDPAAHGGNSAAIVSYTGIPDDPLNCYGLKTSRAAYVYIIDTRFGSWAATAETVSGVSISIPGMPNGTYSVEVTHPSTNEVENRSDVVVSNGTAYVDLPGFTKDIAIKLKSVTGDIDETYTVWRSRVFSSESIIQGNGSRSVSDNNDGVPNWVKYALGVNDPVNATPSSYLPTLGTNESGDLVFEYLPARNGITYQVETSTDLINWSGVQQITSGRTTPVTFTTNANQTQQKTYFRLKVIAE